MIKLVNIKKIAYIVVILLMISFTFINCVYAEGEEITSPNDPIGTSPTEMDETKSSSKSGNSDLSSLSKINNLSGSSSLAKISGQIIGIISVVGTLVSIAMLLIIGIKYMIASPDQKANLKARAVPYLIGAALIFGAANILRFIETMSTWIKK